MEKADKAVRYREGSEEECGSISRSGGILFRKTGRGEGKEGGSGGNTGGSGAADAYPCLKLSLEMCGRMEVSALLPSAASLNIVHANGDVANPRRGLSR